MYLEFHLSATGRRGKQKVQRRRQKALVIKYNEHSTT